MLDDPRETLGAALRRMGHGYNTRDPALLEQAQQMLIEQKPLVRAYSSSNFDAVLHARDVWIAQGWSGQFAKVIDEDPRLAYMVPKEGSSLFLDSLAIPASSQHQELAHAFIDFTLGAGDRRRDLHDDEVLDAEPRGAGAPARLDPQQPGDLPAARRAVHAPSSSRTSARRPCSTTASGPR